MGFHRIIAALAEDPIGIGGGRWGGDEKVSGTE